MAGKPVPRPLTCRPDWDTRTLRFFKRCHGDTRCCNCFEGIGHV